MSSRVERMWATLNVAVDGLRTDIDSMDSKIETDVQNLLSDTEQVFWQAILEQIQEKISSSQTYLEERFSIKIKASIGDSETAILAKVENILDGMAGGGGHASDAALIAQVKVLQAEE